MPRYLTPCAMPWCPTRRARLPGVLRRARSVGVFLGNLGQHHPAGSRLHALAQELAAVTGGRFGFLGEAANSVGGYLVGCVPFGSPSGLNAGEMLRQPLKAYLLLGVEPELDTHDPQQAMAALKSAELVVAMSPYQHGQWTTRKCCCR